MWYIKTMCTTQPHSGQIHLKSQLSSEVFSHCGLGGVGLEGAEVLVGLDLTGRPVPVCLALFISGNAFKEIISELSRLFIRGTKKRAVRVQLRTFWPCRQFLSFSLSLPSPGHTSIWMLYFGAIPWLQRFLRLKSPLGFVFGGNLGLIVQGLGSSGALMNTVVKQAIYTWLYIKVVHY